ncbi:GNAT family N-acetyltransferase [Streptomyces sp. NBC_00876]|uniref:GNAT family N-acetyltransferase n=1 Tax=Streptomyces sp. NBC_00876 TaxID=2975853 RepID=UPI00386688CF|nr:GNAT family N-acetyltransferase [Streptomyces sp. NBC_00876]
MRTSEEIYHRVRWDARFDPARFVLGVAQRGRDPKRVPLERFTPGGDVPWHRVLFFEADGEVVWDRSSGTDRIDATDAGRVRTPRRLPSPYFTSRVPHAFSSSTGTWEPMPARPPGPSGPLTVLTWNTLWDRYDSDRIDTARRRPLLLDALRAADADVIALQEVEPALLELLLACDWVRDGYVLATDPAGRDVPDCGLLLLSRLPVSEAGLHPLGPHKAVAAAVVETAGGPVTVAVTHLSSDHSPDGAARRDSELADLATGLAGIEGELLLVGDFNDGGDHPRSRLAMADAWNEVHGPADRTPTFDPSVNPLAAVSSLSGRVSRLDRILLRTERLRARSAVLTGETPGPEGLYVSDHYGVRVELGAPLLVAEGVTERVVAALPGAHVHVVGSRRMGCAPPGADLDLVAALPGAPDPAAVRHRMAAAFPEARGLREVTGARVPGLRWYLDGLRIDLVTVSTAALSPADAVARRTELGEAAAVALSAVSDAEAVLAAADPHRDAFAALARDVKEWARARGLDSAPCGGLPGLAWTVLAARTAHEAGGLPPLALLRRFFATWAAWDWSEAVGGAAATGDPVTVLTPTAPVRSCTTQVTPAGRDLLTAELFRAWEILEEAAEDAHPRPLLCAPPVLREHHAAWALASAGPGEGDEGRLRGRLLALLAALADAGAPDARIWPHPLTADGRTGYAIGLGTTPPDGPRLSEIGAELLRGIRGASLAPVGLSALRSAGAPAFTLCQTPAMHVRTTQAWSLRPATADDLDATAELRAVVMRPDLVRLGRYDEHRVRRRLRDSYVPEHTSVILVDGRFAGSVTLRPFEDGRCLESFLIAEEFQGRGIGSAVLSALLARTDAEGVPVRLNVLQGSAARRLYERHGFVLEREDPVDVFMVRMPPVPVA